MKAAVLYWSKTGNTGKVASAIRDTLEEAGVDVTWSTIDDDLDIDYFDYDVVFVGFPSYQWRPPAPVLSFLHDRFQRYCDDGRLKTGAPRVFGRHAVMFCTYSGPHTGLREAVPATLLAGQYFEHLGIDVLGEWHIVGEFHGSLERSTQGRLGDIRGRPNDEDLNEVRRDVREVVQHVYGK